MVRNYIDKIVTKLKRRSAAGQKSGNAGAARKAAVPTAQSVMAASRLFDARWYRSQYRLDADAKKPELIEHYLNIGWKKGCDPSPRFSTEGYLKLNPDVAKAGMCPLAHYLLYGRKEGRNWSYNKIISSSAAMLEDVELVKKSAFFDADWYASECGENKLLGLAPERHYVLFGAGNEISPSPDFWAEEYLRQNKDVSGAKQNPLVHFLRHGTQEHRRRYILGGEKANKWTMDIAVKEGLFDPAWYAEKRGLPGDTAPEILFADYTTKAWQEGADPSPIFCSKQYLKINQDVAKSGVCPLLHYMHHGRHEGRVWNETMMLERSPGMASESERVSRSLLFDKKWYVAECDGDVDGFTPAVHYVAFGWRKGLSPSLDFDGAEYFSRYTEAAESGMSPLGHYLSTGKASHLVFRPLAGNDTMERLVEVASSLGVFDAGWYAGQKGVPEGLSDTQLLAHYFETGWKAGLSPSRGFSEDTYMYLNGDLKDMGESALAHFLRKGRLEDRAWNSESLLTLNPERRNPVDRISSSGLFDAEWYVSQNGGVNLHGLAPSEHYTFFGWKDGLNPSPEFDGDWYLRKYKDVAAAGVNPLLHYLKHGRGESRRMFGTPESRSVPRLRRVAERLGLFDLEWYRMRADLPKTADADQVFEHFLETGWKEGLDPAPMFSTNGYLGRNPDVKEAGLNPLWHYLVYGRHERRKMHFGIMDWRRQRRASHNAMKKRQRYRRTLALLRKSSLFDATWYKANNPDVDFSEITPEEHYMQVGWREGRNPSMLFDGNAYCTHYSDVQAADVCPLLHYLRYGRSENRYTWVLPSFNEMAPTKSDIAACRRKSQEPLMSVVVPSFNYADTIAEALQSLVDQTYRNFEVIVVDDGSTDESMTVISEFIARHESCGVDFKLLTHPDGVNHGLPATVKLGVDTAKGEYVAFLEADDIWTPDHLAEVVALTRRYAAPKVILNDTELFGEPERAFKIETFRFVRCKSLRRTRTSISPEKFRSINYILNLSALAVERKLLRSCDFNAEDCPALLIWWLGRQICFANDLYFIDRKLTKWRMHSDSYWARVSSGAEGDTPYKEAVSDMTSAMDTLLRKRHPLSSAARKLGRSKEGALKYEFTSEKALAHKNERAAGLVEYKDAIARNSSKRILVCLHFFYEESWGLVQQYLENLAPYKWDLIVTCIEGKVSDAALARIRRFAPTVKILFTPNCGFDIGPFVEALNHVNLDDYDVVFKLQTKGIRRPFIYIYGQVFKYTDWFFNLFDGVLGGRAVHQIVDAIANNGYMLAAAKNLIVKDPLHKQVFVRDMCSNMGVPYVEKYDFVAGTCFAMSSAALKPLKDLGLTITDFGETVRGKFSLAHFLERWMCFAGNGHVLGVKTPHNVYKEEVAERRKMSAMRMLDDPRFKIDNEFFYRVLETRPVKSYEVVKVRLGDICRRWFDGRLYPLTECAPFEFLRSGDQSAYAEYCAKNKALSSFDMSPERFQTLVQSMDNYDPMYMPVVEGPRNIIKDGQHRSCILLYKYGPDHKIDVLRIR